MVRLWRKGKNQKLEEKTKDKVNRKAQKEYPFLSQRSFLFIAPLVSIRGVVQGLNERFREDRLHYPMWIQFDACSDLRIWHVDRLAR
mmetsp:Transcript_17563/g.26164  ORF Transcript_17563/g.26164 Transcript_17563/m.26164 type:complete len:87 (-) Transcript_17563:246-506(-)